MEWISILGTSHSASNVETFDTMTAALNRIDSLHSVKETARLGHRVTSSTSKLGRIESAECEWLVIRGKANPLASILPPASISESMEVIA
jgi:hypothetical protein